MKKEYCYINDPSIFAIYIKSLKLLIVSTNLDGQQGVVYIVK